MPQLQSAPATVKLSRLLELGISHIVFGEPLLLYLNDGTFISITDRDTVAYHLDPAVPSFSCPVDVDTVIYG